MIFSCRTIVVITTPKPIQLKVNDSISDQELLIELYNQYDLYYSYYQSLIEKLEKDPRIKVILVNK